jgi:hypothetical protein
MPEADIFHVWRWLLSIVVTIYVLVYTARTLWVHVLWFRSSPRFTVMGHYAVVLLLRARIRRFGGEVLRIGLLLALLTGVVGLHWVVL